MSPVAGEPTRSSTRSEAIYVALTGNPNCGKTTLFNALTGLRAKVGNYPGVTVERKEGRLLGGPKDQPIRLLDLPGTYSLTPQSLDEQVARDVLFHRLPEVPPPALVMVIVDASNLQRNLYFATQVIELGYPTVVALNMVDLARSGGQEIDAEKLGKELGVPVFPIVASTGTGVTELRSGLVDALKKLSRIEPLQFVKTPPALQSEVEQLAKLLSSTFPESKFQARAEARLILADERFLDASTQHYPGAIATAVQEARQRLETSGVDWRATTIEARYTRVAEIQEAVTSANPTLSETFSDRLDRVVTHRWWGTLIFILIMTLMFQSIFTFAELPMTWLERGVEAVGAAVGRVLAEGPLHSLLVDGVISGVGAVIVFLPQICLLFLFIGLLEDTGYMARAAFLMDRLMSKVGLHGKSFIPMLSSFACAIPGILATRTIENRKDRLATILVAPLMSCSARLPVYTVLIAACIPDRHLLGFVGLRGLTLLAMYLLGIIVALFMAWIFKRTLLKGPTPMLIMELPPYRRPLLSAVLRHMWDRAKLFLRRAGTIILGIMILLWYLSSYPVDRAAAAQFDQQRAALTNSPLPELESARAEALEQRQTQLQMLDREEAGDKLRHSYAGRLGHWIEPVIQPLGYDWKIGIGIVASFAAREVFVSTMSLVYNVGELDDSDEATVTLAEIMKKQERPEGGRVYTTLVGISLMVFYVFALQCVSTVVIVRRETHSWRWPAFQWVYMGLLAWFLAFVTYQGGRLLGFG